MRGSSVSIRHALDQSETCLVGADGERDDVTVMRGILRAMGEGGDAFD